MGASRATYVNAYGSTPGKGDTIGHGTKIASQIAGTKFGLAKKVDLVFVKITNDAAKMWDSVIDAFAKISDYIDEKGVSTHPICMHLTLRHSSNLNSRSVGRINMSWSLPAIADSASVDKLKELVSYLAESQAVMVTSAGNDGKVSSDGNYLSFPIWGSIF
jgi:subtilisin family serine protease